MKHNRIHSSFRDPSGFLFKRNDVVFRQINQKYAAEYSFLMDSGLYHKLIKAGLLIPHTEVDISPVEPDVAYKVIQPDQVRFISYPYEWSFSQLKDAALATLSIQKRALKLGMSLKDASAYNIQFHNGKPILIDTLSFEIYKEGEPWVAYKQFCQHFLAPLALMAKKDVRLGQMLRIYIDGIPLDLASNLLPFHTRLNLGLMLHIYLHAKAQTRFAEKNLNESPGKKEMSKQAFLGLIGSLKNTIKKLTWKPSGTEWGNYYEITNYSDTAFLHKKQLVAEWVKEIHPKQVWDLGANNGTFSRLASEQGAFVVSFDIDPVAVEQNYLQMKTAKEKNILPLLLDLTNPSPAIGWHNRERESFIERAPVEMVFALALIHHLIISNNTPVHTLVNFFNELGKWLLIEYIPKSDIQAQKLLQNRKDIFDQYTQEDFERFFEERYSIHKKEKINDSQRYLYLMGKR